ncbi:TPA: hypothetical protein EYP38_03600, partial [Candidatus Micrarchaeota archaeon]|nr:hypothetical protein [Candidatus Micrarchaeota archaeon]
MTPNLLQGTGSREALRAFCDSHGVRHDPDSIFFNLDGMGIFVPVEPMGYGPEGMALFANGIGKLARPEIVSLTWGFLRCLEGYLSRSSVAEMGKAIVTGNVSEAMSIAGGRNRGNVEFAAATAGMMGRFSAIPEGFFNLPDVVAGRPESESRELSWSVVPLEACNRFCQHCGAVATPQMEHMAYDDFVEWSGVTGFAPTVAITLGEPFYWRDNFNGQRRNVGHVVEHILESGVAQLEPMTSGIRFSSKVEHQAAEKISSLPAEMRERIAFNLSLSDHPCFSEG